MPVSGWGWAARGTRQSGGMVTRGNAVTEPGKQQSQCRQSTEETKHLRAQYTNRTTHLDQGHIQRYSTIGPSGNIHSHRGALYTQTQGYCKLRAEGTSILKFRQSTLRPQGTVHLGPKAMKTPTQRHCTLRPSIIALPKYRGTEFSFRNTNQIQMQHRQYPSPLLTHI